MQSSKTPKTLTGIETNAFTFLYELYDCVPKRPKPLQGLKRTITQALAELNQGSKTPKTLTGIETGASLEIPCLTFCSKTPKTLTGIETNSGTVARHASTCSKTPKTLTGIETLLEKVHGWGDAAFQNAQNPYRD